MASRGFLPRTDKGLLLWGQNFYAVANPIATALGLTTAELTAFNALVETYSASLLACDPGVRNKAAVLAKRDAANNLRANARLLANAVSSQASVSDSQRAQLGLNVRAQPQPIGRPTTPPAVEIVAVTGRTVVVRLHEQDSSKRGRPEGVDGAAVMSYTGPTAPTDPSVYKLEGLSSKTKFTLVFDNSLAPGATVWISAYWFNERKQSGPASTPISVTFGAANAAQAV